MSEWQPIETVPRDGTDVAALMMNDGKPWVCTARFYPEPGDHWSEGASIIHYNGNTLIGGFKGPFVGWMPLTALARRPSRNDVLEEAAKYHDKWVDLLKAAIDADPRAPNVGMLKRDIECHERDAFAIRALKDKS